MTRIGPVGIDVEAPLGDAKAEFDLLAPFLVVPDKEHRAAQIGPDPLQQFFFYWTALEAFWKALGTGLVSTNPRICLRKNRLGTFDVAFEGLGAQRHAVRVMPLRAPASCAITLALHGADEHMRFTHNNSTALGMALQSYTNT